MVPNTLLDKWRKFTRLWSRAWECYKPYWILHAGHAK